MKIVQELNELSSAAVLKKYNSFLIPMIFALNYNKSESKITGNIADFPGTLPTQKI